jgi:hypothetical protein
MSLAICAKRLAQLSSGCGAGNYFRRRSYRLGGRVRISELSGSLSPLLSARTQPSNQGMRRSRSTMTRTEHNLPARKRGELSRDRGSRRLSQTVAAQRRLNARQTDSTRTSARSERPAPRAPDPIARRARSNDAAVPSEGIHVPRVDALTAVLVRYPETLLTEPVRSRMLAGEYLADQLAECLDGRWSTPSSPSGRPARDQRRTDRRPAPEHGL